MIIKSLYSKKITAHASPITKNEVWRYIYFLYATTPRFFWKIKGKNNLCEAWKSRTFVYASSTVSAPNSLYPQNHFSGSSKGVLQTTVNPLFCTTHTLRTASSSVHNNNVAAKLADVLKTNFTLRFMKKVRKPSASVGYKNTFNTTGTGVEFNIGYKTDFITTFRADYFFLS